MAQIRQVVSESLQATIRRLLPSQQGFTEDLQASNVIMPVIDLTPTAEGSALSTDLARAFAFGSQTAFASEGATTVVVNNAGFYRIVAAITLFRDPSTAQQARFQLSDGLSTKDLFNFKFDPLSSLVHGQEFVDFEVFLDSGESLNAITTTNNKIIGSSRQIADINGNTVNPSGFSAS